MAHLQVSALPLAVLTDSYKACHPLMYPDATKMVAVRVFASRTVRFGGSRQDVAAARLPLSMASSARGSAHATATTPWIRAL